MICLICKVEQKNSRGLAGHLKTHGISAQKYYDKFLKNSNEDICECGNTNAFKSILQGYCKFCSYVCSEDERRANLSKSKKGKPLFALRGYKQTQEHIKSRKVAGEAHPLYGVTGKDHPSYGKRGLVGSANPNWRGGASFEPYGVDFNSKCKLEIRRRDSFACQECGVTEKDVGRRMSVHHIDYNKFNNGRGNLICLCESCHSKSNFNRDKWETHFKGKMMSLLTYNLLAGGGLPTMTSVFERVLVP